MKKHLVLLIAAGLLSAGAVRAAQTTIDIVPCPQSIVVNDGSFSVKGASFKCDKALDARTQQAVKRFADQLSLVSDEGGRFSSVGRLGKKAARKRFKGFAFVHSASLGEEAYRINVRPGAVVVEASTRAGILYAIQSLKQMLPVAIYGSTPAPGEEWSLPCCAIEDEPRFAYRGMHLDCGRHFFSTDEVRKYLDIMAAYKMNRFHWHLTEDQGWRIEIKKYPRLTEVGAWRDGTQIGKDRESNDGIRYGGFYTQDEIRDIVSYADNLGITIIPEVDLPGHMLAALASYPELGCEGSAPYKVWTRWGVCKQVLNPGKEETMRFLEDVVSEVADLFPGEYFHIGGDECPKTEWKTDPDCQAKIRELGLVSDDKASAESRLQNYVTTRIQKCLAAKGKKIIGWDEILEGELAPGATVMSWRGTRGGIKASKAGFDAIMTPTTYCYFDFRQLKDASVQPLAIGDTVLPLSKVYSYNPTDGLDAKAASHIYGVQANLWTEYIATSEHLEYMLLPRMFAISEVQWCRNEVKDFERFTQSIDGHQTKILDILGYNYCPAHE